MARFLLPLLFLVLALPARAVDGVFEINQTCAIETGCFTGDSAGLPVTIFAPGSYRLTSNLVTGSVATTVISVSVENVAVDLGGFTIQGPVTCSGTPAVTSCSDSGFGRGIGLTNSSLHNLAIRNGTIAGMGSSAVRTGRFGTVEHLVVRDNAGGGILAAQNGVRISDCIAERNGGDGILATADAQVLDSVASQNEGRGIVVTDEAVVSGNLVTHNGTTGIQVRNGSLVEQNVINDNNLVDDANAAGLRLENDNRIVGNALDDNGVRNILLAAGDSLVDGNHVTDSTIGIEFGVVGNAYRNNTAAGNSTAFGGTSIGTTIDLGGNVFY